MKILLLAPHPFFQERGTPIAEKAVLEVLSARGDEVVVLTLYGGEDVSIPGVTIERLPPLLGIRNIRPGFSWKKLICDCFLAVRCARLVRSGGFDLIHAVEESAVIAAVMKRLFGIPYVYDMDSSFAHQMIEKYPSLAILRRFFETLERIGVRGSLAVVAVCSALEEIVIAHDPAKPVRRIEDFSLLTEDDPEVESLQAQIGTAGKSVLYVGNLERYQGIDLLLESFRRAQRVVTDAHLVVIGGQETDIGRYSKIVRRFGISEHVHFLGSRPLSHLGGYLRQADILVSPRIKGQNTPMKIYSYLDSGRPVLATRLPTHTQVLDGEIALLADPEPEPFADGLVNLLRDAELRLMLAKIARLRVRELYSREAFQRKTNSFYDLVERELALFHRRRSGR